jgi:hypothetical protein
MRYFNSMRMFSPRTILYFLSLSLSLSLSMTLQPFGPWLLFQFLNPEHSRLGSLEGGSACRKSATYMQNNTNTE